MAQEVDFLKKYVIYKKKNGGVILASDKRSIWSKIFKKKSETRPNYGLEEILSGIAPIYSNGFGDNVYASDVVQQAISSIVTEIKKLDPVHIRMVGNDISPVTGSVQNVLDNPNPLMTTADFIEKIMWNLLLNYNSFVYPIWNGNNLTALYPLQPSRVEFREDNNGKVSINMAFPNGTESDWIPYENIIHIRYKYSASEYMGGNKQGQPDYEPLLNTLNLNDTLLKGLAKSLNLQTTINGVVKFKTMVNSDDQLKRVKEFEEKLQSNKSGLLPIDISSEYIPIQKQMQLLDATTLEFIDKKIFRWFGTSIAIVDGDYTKEQYEAFYQKTLEPIIKSLGQAFTKGLFTNREMQGFNNQIKFYAKELIFMNTQQKIDLFDRLIDSGSCFKNEFRTAFGLKPLPELNGQIAMSSNLANAENNKVDNGGEANE